jgi:hypothetical protein
MLKKLGQKIKMISYSMILNIKINKYLEWWALIEVGAAEWAE